MDRVLHSLIITNYNHGAWYKDSLPMILTQSKKPEEVIIVDDGSTDNSVEIFRDLQKRFPEIKLFLNERNMGANYTVNRAVALAQGKYLSFPSDNIVLPGAYEKCFELLEKFPEAPLCCSLPEYVEVETGRISRKAEMFVNAPTYFAPQEVIGVSKRHLFAVGNTCHTLIIKKKILEEVAENGEFFLSRLGKHSDYFVTSVISLRYGFCYIPEVLFQYRDIKNSFSNTNKSWRNTRDLINKFLNEFCREKYRVDALLLRQSGLLFALTPFSLVYLAMLPKKWNYITVFLIQAFLKRVWSYSKKKMISFTDKALAFLKIQKNKLIAFNK